LYNKKFKNFKFLDEFVMAKKSKYKIPPYDQQHNRVDIFRNAPTTQKIAIISDAAFVNTGFASSTENIHNILSSKNNVLPTFKPQPPAITIKTKQTVLEGPDTSKAKDKILKIFILTFILLALLAIALSLFFTLGKSSDYFKHNRCPVCQKNAYCIINSEQKRICVCRPGFILNNNSLCVQSFCYTGYKPFYNLTENNTFGVSLNNVNNNNIKPFCCPDDSLSTRCCGVPAIDIISKNKRIIGGVVSKVGNWPWIVDVVQIYRTNPNENITIINNCSGALISDRHILTAAHCLVDEEIKLNNEFQTNESMFRVHFGYATKSSVYRPEILNSYERNVSRIFTHELFDTGYLKNDIAILKLDREIERDTNIDYLCLFDYTIEDDLIKNEKFYVAGWGSTSMDMNNPVYSDVLQYVDLEPMPMEECYYINPDPSIYNNSKQICAGFKNDSNINKDTCNGDSGSPLMVRLKGQWFHYGIVSFGSQTDCGRGPAIYTRTAYYYDWIQSKKLL
jgi:hypothetical protein